MIFLMYLAAFLFPLDNFPLMFGGGYKPIAVLIILIYVLVNFPKLFRMKYKRSECYILSFFVISILISAVQCVTNGYRLDGLMDAIQSLVSGFVCYVGFKLFVQQNSKSEAQITKLFLWIIRGYAVAVFVGLLEFIYIYVVPSGAVSDVIHLFVARSDFATTERLHFSFSEPSYISLHTNLFLLPAVIILKKKGLLTRYHQLIVLSFITLSLFSMSIRYFIDIIVFMIAYLFLTASAKILVKRIATFVVMLAAIVTIVQLIFIQNVFHMSSDHYYRMASMIKNPDSSNSDLSTQIRKTYTAIGFDSFYDHPLLGYGLGNFHYAYVRHYTSVDPSLLAKADELKNARTVYNLVTYNMYARLSSEMGLSGFLLIVMVIYLMVSKRMRNFSLLMMFLTVYSQLQFDSFALVQLFFWIAMIQSRYIAELHVGDADHLLNRVKGKIKALRNHRIEPA
ncbi:hypothetical protein NIE88_00190 [Sporolactobacillus shoreicorticis]|uniref:O-antigen ligase family protein n=1 Tax=Sporolactobacillus shoreicorticis TaxID=1923877 RepID=A0ABW5S487_9BACL|nr:O-antigen ligase family protein [Sporolactobacillus shoreicorticis]MCO7124209.1 hypothetical protein [Sporolactobacillus shoreicorticis]